MQSLLCTYLNGHLLEAPREYVLLGLNPGLDWTSCWLSSISIFLVCSGPPSIFLFTPTTHVSYSNPLLPAGQLNTNVQVNNMATLHHLYTVTHIYITFILLFIPFILLPLLSGRLVQTLRYWVMGPDHLNLSLHKFDRLKWEKIMTGRSCICGLMSVT